MNQRDHDETIAKELKHLESKSFIGMTRLDDAKKPKEPLMLMGKPIHWVESMDGAPVEDRRAKFLASNRMVDLVDVETSPIDEIE